MRSGVIVLLGPGRSGTTSLYHAFRNQTAYTVFDDKESGTLSFGFDEHGEKIKRLSAGKVFIEATPSNLLNSSGIVKNLKKLNLETLGFCIIKRPVMPRMVSLYLHHKSSGNISESFDDYILRSHELAVSTQSVMTHSTDITYFGLREYDIKLLELLPEKLVWIIGFEKIFDDINELLRRLELPQIAEVNRNQSYEPRLAYFHRTILYVYRRLNLRNIDSLSGIKNLYKRMNSASFAIEASDQTRQILESYQSGWNSALSRFQHLN